jgi:hypothetical protein
MGRDGLRRDKRKTLGFRLLFELEPWKLLVSTILKDSKIAVVRMILADPRIYVSP